MQGGILAKNCPYLFTINQYLSVLNSLTRIIFLCWYGQAGEMQHSLQHLNQNQEDAKNQHKFNPMSGLEKQIRHPVTLYLKLWDVREFR